MSEEQKLIGFSSQEELERALREYNSKPETIRFKYLGRRIDSGEATAGELREYDDLTWSSHTNMDGRLRPDNYPPPEFFPYKLLSDRIEEFAGEMVRRAWAYAWSTGSPPETSGYYQKQDGTYHAMPPDDPELNGIMRRFWNKCDETFDRTDGGLSWAWQEMTFFLTERRVRDARFNLVHDWTKTEHEYDDEEEWERRNLGEVELIRH